MQRLVGPSGDITIRFALALLLLPLTAACVALPIPHAHQQTPEILGALHRGGAPIADLRVHRRAEWSSRTLVDSVRTDEAGRFAFAGTRNFHPGSVIWLAGVSHHRYVWEVCFETPREGELCWQDSAYTPGQAPRQVRLECDLELIVPTPNHASDDVRPAERRADQACHAGGDLE